MLCQSDDWQPQGNVTKIHVDPEVYASAARSLAAAAEAISSALPPTLSALSAAAPMAGSDDVGTIFSGGLGGAGGYDGAAADIFAVLPRLVGLVRDAGRRVETAGKNWAAADDASAGPTPFSPLPAPAPTETNSSSGSPPSALGDGGSRPDNEKAWALLKWLLDKIPAPSPTSMLGGAPFGQFTKFWPNGSGEKLRTAGDAWYQLGSKAGFADNDVRDAKSKLSSQQAPDVELATAQIQDDWEKVSAASHACEDLSGSCKKLAGTLDTAHDDLNDLLDDLWHELGKLAMMAGVVAAGGLGGIAGSLTGLFISREEVLTKLLQKGIKYIGRYLGIMEKLIQGAEDSSRAAFYAGAKVQGLFDKESAPALPPGVQIPPPGTDPQQVADWWNGLTQEQRDQLRASHSQALGNLVGIPLDVRGEINTDVMNDDLSRVLGAAGVTIDLDQPFKRDADGHLINPVPEDVLKNPWKYGLSQADIERYNNAFQTKAGIDHQQESLPGTEVLLIAYDPLAFGGKGRAAIAIGNPDKATNTAVIVPGTGSSVAGGWLSDGHNDGINLYNESNRADPNNPTAVVLWMGYEAPDWDLQHVGTPTLARAGADLLATDVNGLAVTHDPAAGEQHTTVLGHSYGSTTVADAVVHGMHADDVVLVGCPGTDELQSAQQAHDVYGTNVYVGSASNDPITMIGGAHDLEIRIGDQTAVSLSGVDALNAALGYPVDTPGLGNVDPASAQFGATRFDAEIAPGTPNADPGSISGSNHSHYYDRGSESLYNMADIVSGHPERLSESDSGIYDGGLAPYRTPTGREIDETIHVPYVDVDINVHLPLEGDSESTRPGVTRDHRH